MNKKFLNFFTNYFLHSIILFTFLSFFYIFHVSNLTQTRFTNETTKLYIEATDLLITDNDLIFIKSLSKTKPDYTQLDNVYSVSDPTSGNNNKLLFQSLIIFIIFLWICLFFIFTKIEISDLSIIILENIIILIFLGVIEYYFFTEIVLKYIPMNSSSMKTEFVRILLNRT